MKSKAGKDLILLDKVLIFIPAFVIPLIYTVKVPDPALLPRFIALSLFVFILSILVFKEIYKSSIHNIVIPLPYFILYAIYISITGLSLFYTSNFADGIFDWLKTIVVFCFILLFTQYLNQKNKYVHILILSVLVFSLVINAIGYYQFFMVYKKIEFGKQDKYEISYAFAHRNLFSEMLFLTLPFTIYGIYYLKKHWKAIAIFTSLLTLCSIGFYMTRAVWIATIVSFAFISILSLIAFRKELIQSSNKKLKITALLSLLFIGALASFIILKIYDVGILKEHFYSIFDTRYGSVHHRLLLWQKTLEISSQNLWTGTGLGSWKIEILKYGIDGLQSEDGITFYQRPHNDFLWVMSEAGVIAAILYLAILFIPYSLLFRMFFLNAEISKKLFYLALLFGLTGYLIIANFGFPKERIEHLIYLSFFTIPAFIEWRSNYKTNVPLSVQPVLYAIIPLVLFITIVGLKRFSSERHIMEAYKARSRSGWDKMIKEIDSAKSTWCTLDPTSTPLDWYRGSANYNKGNIKEALVDFKAAYEVNPYHVHVLNNIATCAQLTGDTKTAIEYYEKALLIYPHFEDAVLNLAAIYFNNGEIDSAYAAIRRVDPEIESEKFKQYALTILNKKIETYKFPEEQNVAEVIAKILKDEVWTIDILKKSIDNNITIEQQLLKDGVYVLEEVERKMSSEEAKLLKIKYEIF